ncbi:MAG: hypothetical protein M3Q03_01800 [Chloroflexota bacterium]|nr:hypothetical protein [Chloroflexota bacterium]
MRNVRLLVRAANEALSRAVVLTGILAVAMGGIGVALVRLGYESGPDRDAFWMLFKPTLLFGGVFVLMIRFALVASELRDALEVERQLERRAWLETNWTGLTDQERAAAMPEVMGSRPAPHRWFRASKRRLRF